MFWSTALSLFVVAGNSGVLRSSPDGITWTPRTSGTASDLFDLADSGALPVAVGSGGVILTSPDGVTWTTRTSGTASTLAGVSWDQSVFVAVGAYGVILSSPDGVTWTARTSGVATVLRGTDHHFLATGDEQVLVSRDGVAWYFADGIADHNNTEAAWNGRVAVPVGAAHLPSLRL